MENVYSTVMFILAGALLFYALLLQTGDVGLIPYRTRHSLPKSGTKAHIRLIGRILAVVAAAPLLSGVVGLFTDPEVTVIPQILLPLIGFPFFIWLGIRLFYQKKNEEDNGGTE